MKLTSNRSLVPRRIDLTMVMLIAGVLCYSRPDPALNCPHLQDPMPLPQFVLAGPINMQWASNIRVQKPGVRKVQTFTDQAMLKHIADSDLIMVGRVSAVRPWIQTSQNRPISEHDPQWQQAIVQVETVMKGSVSRRRVTVLFPGTLDVAWVDVPKFKVGERGVWIVKRDPKTAAFAVVDPLDFHPRSQRIRVRRLVNAIRK